MKDDGGNAFPTAGHYDGMTLRDYFAGQAIQGILAGASKNAPADKLAEQCYQAADAMIKERNKV